MKTVNLKQSDIAKLEVLTIDNAKQAITIINKDNPEWGIKRFNYDNSSYKHHTHGTGANSTLLFEGEFHFWAIVEKYYLISDIDCINALEDGRLIIFFKDNNKVKTDSVDFLDNGRLDFGYIYE